MKAVKKIINWCGVPSSNIKIEIVVTDCGKYLTISDNLNRMGSITFSEISNEELAKLLRDPNARKGGAIVVEPGATVDVGGAEMITTQRWVFMPSMWNNGKLFHKGLLVQENRFRRELCKV